MHHYDDIENVLRAIIAPCEILSTEMEEQYTCSLEDLLLRAEASLALWRFPDARKYAHLIADDPQRHRGHLRCHLLSLSARLALIAGDTQSAIRGISTALECAEQSSLHHLVRYQWASILEITGNYPDALRSYTDVLKSLDSSDEALTTLSLCGAARIEYQLGDFASATRILETQTLACNGEIAPLLLGVHRAQLLVAQGHLDQAMRLLSSLRPSTTTLRTKILAAMYDIVLLSAYRGSLQWDQARSLGEALCQRMEEELFPYFAAYAHYEFAQVFSDKHSPYYSPPLALEHFHRALSHLEQAPFCDLQARIHLGLAQTYRAIKHDRKAFAHLQRYSNFHTTALSIRTVHEIKQAEIELAIHQKALELSALEHRYHVLEQQMNSALRTVEEYKQRMDEQISYLGVVAHDLKNPIAAILMSASIIERYGHKLTQADLAKHTSAIARTAETMKELVTSLLDFTALSTGRMTLTIEPVHAQLLFDVVIEAYRVRALAKSLTISKQYPASDLYVLADSKRLQECLDNILSNAIKYSPLGRTIYCTIETHDQHLRFLIRDEGPGLNEEEQRRLFREFTRARSTATGNEGGTGLGLSIVQRFVEAMHGHVGCVSRPGHGSTFYIELPRAQVNEKESIGINAARVE
jgi:signal transduction histidine kinase